MSGVHALAITRHAHTCRHTRTHLNTHMDTCTQSSWEKIFVGLSTFIQHACVHGVCIPHRSRTMPLLGKDKCNWQTFLKIYITVFQLATHVWLANLNVLIIQSKPAERPSDITHIDYWRSDLEVKTSCKLGTKYPVSVLYVERYAHQELYFDRMCCFTIVLICFITCSSISRNNRVQLEQDGTFPIHTKASSCKETQV